MNELLEALEKLSNELHKNRKLNVKKDFSLMIADSHARKLINQYKEATQ
jgi:ATP-dependent protease HslVU (ClpYQ) ATPase subunit